MRAAAGGGGGSGSAEPQAAITGRRALIGREVLVYLAGAGPARSGCLQPSGVLESAGHRKRMPNDEHGHVSGGNTVSGVYRSVVPWDGGHQLSGRVNFYGARPPHW